MINLLIEADRVEPLVGSPQPVAVPRDDGSEQTIFRCPTCQVAVFSHHGHLGVLFVRGGTLDDPSGLAPDVNIFTKSRLSWITLPDSVPAWGTASAAPLARGRSAACVAIFVGVNELFTSFSTVSA